MIADIDTNIYFLFISLILYLPSLKEVTDDFISADISFLSFILILIFHYFLLYYIAITPFAFYSFIIFRLISFSLPLPFALLMLLKLMRQLRQLRFAACDAAGNTYASPMAASPCRYCYYCYTTAFHIACFFYRFLPIFTLHYLLMLTLMLICHFFTWYASRKSCLLIASHCYLLLLMAYLLSDWLLTYLRYYFIWYDALLDYIIDLIFAIAIWFFWCCRLFTMMPPAITPLFYFIIYAFCHFAIVCRLLLLLWQSFSVFLFHDVIVWLIISSLFMPFRFIITAWCFSSRRFADATAAFAARLHYYAHFLIIFSITLIYHLFFFFFRLFALDTITALSFWLLPYIWH